MDGKLPERKRPVHHPSIDRHNQPVIHFVTVCTKARRALLATPLMHEILREAWTAADSFRVGRYVIMPDHVHLFCSPVEVGPDYMEPWIRYWRSLATQKHPDGKSGQFWQRDFWDTQMRSSEHYSAQRDYIRHNPVRHGFVSEPEDWPHQGELTPCGWQT